MRKRITDECGHGLGKEISHKDARRDRGVTRRRGEHGGKISHKDAQKAQKGRMKPQIAQINAGGGNHGIHGAHGKGGRGLTRR